ncbi:MAG: Gfo/Idh/MocA family oxidoreductase [Chthoniobacterales bacterium]
MSDSPPSIGLAIVGCGLIGRKRALNLPENFRLEVVCDVDPERAGSMPRGARVETDFGGVLADKEVQAVFICTTNAALSELALLAVRAGKHVLIEKPGGRSAAELREISEAAAETGALVRIGYNHRYHPAFQKARELVDSGVCGEPMFLRARYGHGGRVGYDREWRADPKLSGGGELIDQGVHLIDLAGWFFGEFSQVDGHATTSFWDMPVDDNAFLSLRTAGGQTAWMHASCSEWKNLFCFEYYGRDAKWQIDGLGGSYGTERLTFYKMLPEMGPPETTAWEYPRGDQSWKLEMAEFAEDIRLGRTPVPGLAEGVTTLEIVGTIYERSGF